MHQSAGPVLVVIQQDQLAVGIKAAQHRAGDIGDQGIHALLAPQLNKAGGLGHLRNVIGVHLAGAGHMLPVRAQHMSCDIKVLQHGLPVVPAVEAEVQALVGAGRKAALTGEKGVPQFGIDRKLRRGVVDQILLDLLAKFRHTVLLLFSRDLHPAGGDAFSLFVYGKDRALNAAVLL